MLHLRTAPVNYYVMEQIVVLRTSYYFLAGDLGTRDAPVSSALWLLIHTQARQTSRPITRAQLVGCGVLSALTDGLADSTKDTRKEGLKLKLFERTIEQD